MTHSAKLLISAIFAGLSVVTAITVSSPAMADNGPVPSVRPKPNKDGKYLFSVTLHTKNEINSMLTRAETLSKKLTFRNKNHAGIALVLHGPEIELFTKKNYSKNQQLIDKAARLDSSSVIEIKICRTAMDEMNIEENELPAFVEIVPFGPDEEDRLIREGYSYL